MNEVTDQKAEPRAEKGFEVIAPIDFEPSGRARRAGLAGLPWLGAATAVLLLLLAAIAWYLFSGRSVQLVFSPPTDQVELEGALVPLKLGERWLLHPGRYRVSARLAGHEDFATEFVVADLEDQSFTFELIKLPGYLNLTTDALTPAHVWINEEPVSPAPLTRYQLRPGSYDLVVRAPRYHDYQTSLEIEGGEVEQTLVIAMEPAWAEVAIASSPPGATLYVDGDPVGETPLTAEIIEGSRQLELNLDGYKPWRSRLEVEAGQNLALPEVALAKADNLIEVASIPGGASVTVDGEYRGQTPMQLALQAGRNYRIGFAKAGYATNERIFDVVEGDDARLTVRLAPVLGSVRVEGTPAEAEVYVNDVFQGRINDQFELPAHPHRVEVRAEGYEPFATSVTPNPEQQQRIAVALTSFDAQRAARMPDVLVSRTGYRLKRIQPSGIFRLGSPRREQGRRANEFLRQVQLSRPFYIGLTEVTNAEFKAFNPSHDSGVADRHTLALKDQPAVRVSWDQAARYCNWLSQRDGLPPAYREVDGRMVPVTPMTTGYRLPTEAEWAYIARYEGRSGGAALRYAWGASMPPPPGVGNFAGIESQGVVPRPLTNYTDEYPATAPVGKFPPNPLGLYDLDGNVREWMHDYYLIHTGSLGDIPVDPLGPDAGETHVIRGAGWRSGSITELRLAYRDDGAEGRDDVGFRVARYAEEN